MDLVTELCRTTALDRKTCEDVVASFRARAGREPARSDLRSLQFLAVALVSVPGVVDDWSRVF